MSSDSFKFDENHFSKPISSSSTNSERMYEVKENDDLRKIAVHFGNVTVTQIARYNSISMLGSSANLYPGQVIYIPSEDDIKANTVRKCVVPGVATHVPSNNLDPSTTKNSRWYFNPFSWTNNDSSYNFPIGSFPPTSAIKFDNRNFTEEDLLDKNFVKLPAIYIYFESKRNKEIPGILLMTLDTICFDAAKSKCIETSASDTEINDSLTIHIPFDTVTSFNTHTNLSKLMEKNLKITDQTFSQNNEVPVEHQPDLKKSKSDKNDEECVYLALCTSPTKLFVMTSDSDTLLHQSEINKQDELSDFHELSTKKNQQEFFVFKCPMKRFDELCSFMLKARAPGCTNSNQITLPSMRLESYHSLSSLVADELANLEGGYPEIQILNSETSTILTGSMISDLSRKIPSHWAGFNLRLIYKSDRDGYSLATVYRKARDVENAMCLLVRDTSGVAFGAIMSEQMHCSHHFYGTGESCVFNWNPDFKLYEWTKKNYFFMRGSLESFQIGAQSGHSAIWFDAGMKFGRSEATETFDNPVLCGCIPQKSPLHKKFPNFDLKNDSESVAFIIDKVELWELVI